MMELSPHPGNGAVRVRGARPSPSRGRASGRTLVDFGVGDPREVTPAFIRDALAAAVEPILLVSARGRPAGAPSGDRRFIDRRFGAAVDPDTR